jgi:sulfite exporter TauE/SafE
MASDLIAYLQIFGIGFTFAIAGPCLLVCTPILLTYIVGRQDKWPRAVADIAIFLFGRLSAYVALGVIAGGSGYYLRHFIKSDLTPYFTLTSGGISVLLGVFVFTHKDPPACASKASHNKIYDFGSVLALGFMVGINPCPPLTALLFEIALISKSASEGASYALSFGLGTFLAGLIVIGTLAGILKGFTKKMIHSRRAGVIFKILCSVLLILFGLGLIRSGVKAI